MDIFVNLFVLWFLSIFFPEKKSKGRVQGDPITATNLLVADSIFHTNRDEGKPKSFEESDNNDPFLNENYDDGPGW